MADLTHDVKFGYANNIGLKFLIKGKEFDSTDRIFMVVRNKKGVPVWWHLYTPEKDPNFPDDPKRWYFILQIDHETSERCFKPKKFLQDQDYYYGITLYDVANIDPVSGLPFDGFVRSAIYTAKWSCIYDVANEDGFGEF
jgi:hypothetical protein